MKILILGSKEYPLGTNKGEDEVSSGGIEFYNQALVEELAKRQRIKLITRKFSKTKLIEKNNNLEIYRVNWKKGFWIRTPSFILNSFRLALRLNFDIILAHGQLATLVGIFLSKIKHKPLVSVPHGIASLQPQYGFLGKIAYLFEKWIFSKPNAVIALSSNDMLRLRKLNCKIKLHLIPTGVSLERFSMAISRNRIRRELDISDKTVLILSNSRLIEVKGLKFLIASLQKLQGNFVLFIAGSGPQEQELKKQVASLKLSDKVKFLGFRNDVPTLLAAADIFVLPSLSEGLPLSLLEAMASSCACVVTDVGLPIDDQKTGLVVPPADASSLAKALQKLIDDKPFRKRLGAQARSFVEQFSWKKTASLYIDLFSQLTK